MQWKTFFASIFLKENVGLDGKKENSEEGSKKFKFRNFKQLKLNATESNCSKILILK